MKPFDETLRAMPAPAGWSSLPAPLLEHLQRQRVLVREIEAGGMFASRSSTTSSGAGVGQEIEPQKLNSTASEGPSQSLVPTGTMGGYVVQRSVS